MALNFVILGAAGYIAPKHMQAIKDVGGNLIAVCDPHSSVGILDKYFPECQYFNEIELLQQFCNRDNKVDYVVICTPNYLHVSHCDIAMRLGANVICEKPVALYEKDIDYLLEVENKTGKKVYPILQLRNHPDVIKLKNECQFIPDHFIEIKYCSPRGKWYNSTWKNEIVKSGGLATNIGIHLFDIAYYLLGDWKYNKVNEITEKTVSGVSFYGHSEVSFYLSISQENKYMRDVIFYGQKLDLYKNFTELHTTCYKQIISGNGFNLESCRDAIKAVENIRNTK